MADDITDTEGLRLIAWSLEGGNVQMVEECRRAADEIDRLRAAGDALAKVSALDLCDCSNDDCMALRDAHQAWKQARQ